MGFEGSVRSWDLGCWTFNVECSMFSAFRFFRRNFRRTIQKAREDWPPGLLVQGQLCNCTLAPVNKDRPGAQPARVGIRKEETYFFFATFLAGAFFLAAFFLAAFLAGAAFFAGAAFLAAAFFFAAMVLCFVGFV